MSHTVLTVANVSKSYGPRKALDDVSLSVEGGQFVALLGPNGAGKTTLFQLLSGLFVVDDGAIRVLDQDIGRSPVKALGQLGIVFQQPTLDLDLSVQANLLFHARLHGMPSGFARERIRAELERVHLSDRAHDSVRSLSGGNRRKVELARALVHEPSLLLMDEPTVGLDPGSRAQLLDDVLALCAERSVGVLWATHLVDEAERANAIIVINQGVVEFSGTGGELVAQSSGSSLGEAFLSITQARSGRDGKRS